MLIDDGAAAGGFAYASSIFASPSNSLGSSFLQELCIEFSIAYDDIVHLALLIALLQYILLDRVGRDQTKHMHLLRSDRYDAHDPELANPEEEQGRNNTRQNKRRKTHMQMGANK